MKNICFSAGSNDSTDEYGGWVFIKSNSDINVISYSHSRWGTPRGQ